MALAYETTRAQESSSLLRHLNTLRSDIAERVARRRHYRQTLTELSWLTDRELADLGIHRSQISEIAREAAAKVR